MFDHMHAPHERIAEVGMWVLAVDFVKCIRL